MCFMLARVRKGKSKGALHWSERERERERERWREREKEGRRERELKHTGNTKGGSITVPLTSCLTGLDWSVL